MASASVRTGQPVHGEKSTSWLGKVFELNPAGINWPRAVTVLDVLLVPLVLFWAIGHQEYLLSAIFGVVFTALADPGGSYGYRVSHTAVFGLIGAGLTALGFGIGGDAWGWLVLAAGVVTLVAGLAAMFGVHRFISAYILNVQFIIALVMAAEFHKHAHITSYTWAQVLAWAGGSALWIAVSFVGWLIRGRHDLPAPFAELPGDTSRRKLTPPLIMFALLRAIVVAGTFALAFGLNLTYGYWMTIAALVAMKASLEQSTITGVQRLAGALFTVNAPYHHPRQAWRRRSRIVRQIGGAIQGGCASDGERAGSCAVMSQAGRLAWPVSSHKSPHILLAIGRSWMPNRGGPCCGARHDLDGAGLGVEYINRRAEIGGSAIDAAYTTPPDGFVPVDPAQASLTRDEVLPGARAGRGGGRAGLCHRVRTLRTGWLAGTRGWAGLVGNGPTYLARTPTPRSAEMRALGCLYIFTHCIV